MPLSENIKMNFNDKMDEMLKPYKKMCRELDENKSENIDTIYDRFLKRLEVSRKKFFPTVEEKQRQMTDDNLKGVFV